MTAIKKTIKNERHQVIHPVTEVDAVEGLNEALAQKQDLLNSGVNIKTINGESILGPGNMIIDGGGSTISVDTEMSDTSENPVQNKVITQAISGFITNSVDDLINYYLKSETYNKTEVDSLIAAVNQFSYEVAASLPTASASTMYKIYLIPSSRPETQNVKDEYITIRSGSEGSYTYSWEQIGSTAIDLSDYVTTSALNTALAAYTTTAQLNTLLAAKQDVINDLSTIRSGAAAGATAYQKPSGGIPKTDLNSGVQASLDLADSAVQADPVGSVTPPVTPSDWATAEQVEELEAKVDDISTGKYYGYYATANDLPDDTDVDGFAYVGTGPTYTIYNSEGGVWTSSGITVNQSPIGNGDDIDQDSSGKLQFANRTYNAQNPNGMGYVILRKDKTFSEQVTAANTIYEIRYDYTFTTGLTLPENITLLFKGGKLVNNTGSYMLISLQSNTKVLGGRFEECSLNIRGNNVLIDGCTFINNSVPYFCLQGTTYYSDLKHITVRNCYFEHKCEHNSAIDFESVDSNRVCEDITFENNVIYYKKGVALTYLNNNAEARNGIIRGNRIYFVGTIPQDPDYGYRHCFAISVEEQWDNVNVTDNYCEGVLCGIETVGSNNINIARNTIKIHNDFSIIENSFGIWNSNISAGNGVHNIEDNVIIFDHVLGENESLLGKVNAIFERVCKKLNIKGNYTNGTIYYQSATSSSDFIKENDSVLITIENNVAINEYNANALLISDGSFDVRPNTTIITSGNLFEANTAYGVVRCLLAVQKILYIESRGDTINNSYATSMAALVYHYAVNAATCRLIVSNCYLNGRRTTEELWRLADGQALELGVICFNNNTKQMNCWDGSKWIENGGRSKSAILYGATSSRPSLGNTYDKGYIYFDTDLGKSIVWNGSAWVNMDGTALS